MLKPSLQLLVLESLFVGSEYKSILESFSACTQCASTLCCPVLQQPSDHNKTELLCSFPSPLPPPPPPPPLPPRTVVKQALSAGEVPVHNSMYSLTSSELTACLMQANAVKLDALWVHMSPDDATLKNLQTAAQISAVQNLQARNNLNKDISQVW